MFGWEASSTPQHPPRPVAMAQTAQSARMPHLPRTTPKSSSQFGGTSDSLGNGQKYSPEKLIERLIQPLSLDAQQSILSMVNIMQVNSRNALQRIHHLTHEMTIQRNDVDKTKAELLIAMRNAEIHRGKFTEERERNEALKAVVADKDDHATRVQVLFNRLQHDNMLLRESFEAMKLSAPQPQPQLSSSSSSPHMHLHDAVAVAVPLGDTFRDQQRLLQDAELLITEDADEVKWFDPTDDPDLLGTLITHGASRRPATAPPGTPADGETKLRASVKFDASVVDRPRPSTTDGKGRRPLNTSGPATTTSMVPLGTAGGARSRSSSPGQHAGDDDDDDYVRTQAISHRALYARFNTPKEDYLLPPSTHPINGTYRNPPDGHLIEKLRYALLRMTRDKYRSGKREKILNQVRAETLSSPYLAPI